MPKLKLNLAPELKTDAAYKTQILDLMYRSLTYYQNAGYVCFGYENDLKSSDNIFEVSERWRRVFLVIQHWLMENEDTVFKHFNALMADDSRDGRPTSIFNLVSYKVQAPCAAIGEEFYKNDIEIISKWGEFAIKHDVENIWDLCPNHFTPNDTMLLYYRTLFDALIVTRDVGYESAGMVTDQGLLTMEGYDSALIPRTRTDYLQELFQYMQASSLYGGFAVQYDFI